MSTINDTDQFLVQRGTTSHKQSAVDLMSTIEDSDLMLIQRGTASYKVTCKDVMDQLGGGGCKPITVSKGEITPSSDVQAGQTLTGSATVSNNVEPTVYHHKWYVDGVRQQEAVSNTFVAVEGSVIYQLCVTDPNNIEQVCGELSDAVDVSEADKPYATMHGLRFDSNRTTILSRSGGSLSSTFTFSGWVKPTGYTRVLSVTADDYKSDSTYIVFNIDASGKTFVDFNNGVDGGSNSNTGSTSYAANTWHHFVAVVTPDDITIYVDGTQDSKYTADLSGVTGLFKYSVGSTKQTSLSGDQYYSDAYLVDGQALKPEVFGNSFEGRWGPKDSDEVEAGIANPTPPEGTQWNTDEVWSNQTTGAAYDGNVKENAFDGNLTTSEAAPADGTTMSFIPNEQLDGQVTIIAKGGDVNSQSNLLTVNGIDYTMTLNQAGAAGQIHEFDVGQGNINTTQGITWSRAASGGVNFCHIYGIKVGGKLLVDTGSYGDNGFHLPFDPAATGVNISNNTTITGSQDLRDPLVNAFDGSLETYTRPQGNESTTVTFDSTIDTSSGLRFYVQNGGGDNPNTANTFLVNGVDYSSSVTPTAAWISIPQSSLSSFTMASDNIQSVALIYAIEVNGEILINYNNIGVDASGNDNHFHDENFAVGNFELGNQDEVWSAYLTLEDGSVFPNDTSAAKGFDGNLNTRATINKNTNFVLTLPVGKSISTGASGLEFALGRIGGSNSSMTYDWEIGAATGSFTIPANTSGFVPMPGTENLTIDSSNVFKIKVNPFNTEGVSLGGLKANGVILIDGNQVWSDNVTNAATGKKGFDGTEDNWYANDGEVSTWTGSVPFTTLRMRITSAANTGTYGDFRVNGVFQNPAERSKHWFTPTGITSPLTSIQIDRTNVNSGCQITKIEVDGKLLIDANIQDTVKDTPLRNAAVLESGSNGNLEATANGTNVTYTGEAGTDYYYEADGVGVVHTGGDPFSSTGGVTYNFGQQPFAAPNVIHNIDAGTVVIDGETYSTLYQTWSEWTSLLLVARVEQNEARISQLEQVIIAQSVPFEKDKVYPKGAIVDFGGNLLEALVDGADITRSDLFRKRFGTVVDQVEWADLEIKTREVTLPELEKPTTLPAPVPEPTPDPEPPLFGNGSTSSSIL